MNILFDFDHTIYDTQLLHRALIATLSQFGVSEDEYQDMYSDITKWKLFTLKALVQRVARMKGIEGNDIIKQCELVAEQSLQFLYDDVVNGFKILNERGHDLYIVSWGDYGWQKKKIDSSCLLVYVKDSFYIDQTKPDFIASWKKDHGNIIYVDDKPVELMAVYRENPEIQCVRMKRDKSKYGDQPTPSNLKEVLGLDDLIEYVNTVS